MKLKVSFKSGFAMFFFAYLADNSNKKIPIVIINFYQCIAFLSSRVVNSKLVDNQTLLQTRKSTRADMGKLTEVFFAFLLLFSIFLYKSILEWTSGATTERFIAQRDEFSLRLMANRFLCEMKINGENIFGCLWGNFMR